MTANHWFFILLEGIIFLILGMFAISQPFFTTLSVEFFLGVLLVAVGLAQIIRGVTNRRDTRLLTTLVGGIIALIAGGLLLAYPVTGALTLTLLVAVFFILDGIAKIVNALQFRPVRGWGWLLFSGVISLVLAGLIFSGWPSTAGWVIGLYVGIYLLFLGISLIMLSIYLKKEPS